jgi:hypothetical protein
LSTLVTRRHRAGVEEKRSSQDGRQNPKGPGE